MTRVWLTEWEWACGGEPFRVGDEVDFGIERRTPYDMLADVLGPALAATLDAVESHHEEEFTDRVRGRVVAVHVVTQGVIERRSLRRPGHGAPPDAVMPPDGEEWPFSGMSLGNGVFAGTQPSRYVVEIVPVADSAELTAVDGVRLPTPERDEPRSSTTDIAVDPPPERHSRSHAGWLVDVDEH